MPKHSGKNRINFVFLTNDLTLNQTILGFPDPVTKVGMGMNTFT